MDSELRLISAVLHGNAAAQTEFWEKQLPLSLFPMHEQEMHWIMRHREKHGKFPSVALFEQRFDVELGAVDDPVSSCIDPLLRNAAYAEIKRVVDKTSEMFDSKTEPTDIVEYFRSSAASIQSHSASYVDESLSDPSVALRRYQDFTSNTKVKGRYIQTPWAPLNKLLNYIRPEELFVLTARPSIGKTWCLLTIMDHLAKQGVPGFVLSKEMSTQSVADRLTALRFGLDWEKFRAGKLSPSEQVQWKIAARKSGPYPLLVSGEETMEGTGLEHLYAKVQKIKPQVIAVDGAYLLKIKGISARADERERYAEVSRALKRLAKATKTQVFAVIQMNREAESKPGIARGSLGTVYGTDAWAQDSDFLIEVGGERGSNERVLSVLKSRETGIGDMFINFRLSPKPDFSAKVSLSAQSAMSKVAFKVIR